MRREVIMKRVPLSPVRWLCTVAGTALLCGCSSGPALPRGMMLDGVALQKSGTWSHSGVSGVVFIPKGEQSETASVQLGVLLSKEHTSGQALSEWVMGEYHRSPTMQLYENASADEACKVGAMSNGTSVRQFLALHVCRGRRAHAACAEVDERLVDPSGSPCGPSDSVCWQRLCDSRWADRRATLQSIVEQVLAQE
jgi:hypothetical protein